MELDQNTILALVIVAGAVLFALWPKGKRVTMTASVPPGRALIDAFEESGKNGAGSIIETRLGEQKASEIMASLGNAFGPTAAAQRPASPASGASAAS